MIKKLFKNKLGIILSVVILLIIGIWAGKGLFKYDYIFTHDGDYMVARSIVAIKTLKEGGFPLRWAGSMNSGCGIPIFNFFYPLIYYLESFYGLFSENIYFGQKVIMFLSILVGGISFFAWTRTKVKKTLPSLIGAILYMMVPYRFILIYVRGNPEYLTYALLPLVLFLFEKVIQSKSKKLATLFAFFASLSGALLLISHNIGALLVMPLIFLYLAVNTAIEKIDLKRKLLVFFAYASAFGLSSFFVFPALLESKFVQLGTKVAVDYREQFPSLLQLIRSKWGFYYSSSGLNDGMSFMLGYAQWFVLGIVGIWLVLKLCKSIHAHEPKDFFYKNVWILSFFLVSLITIFLMTEPSKFIWRIVTPLQQIQFPWRLLGIGAFSTGALSTFFLSKLKRKWTLIVFSLLFAGLAIIGNRNYIRPQQLDNATATAIIGSYVTSTTTIADEILSVNADSKCLWSTPFIMQDNNETVKYQIRDRKELSGSVEIFMPNPSGKAVLGLEYFPEIYNFYLNGNHVKSYDDCRGRACISSEYFRKGENFLTWKVGETLVEKIFDSMSIIFVILWLVVLALTFINKPLQIKRKHLIVIFSVFLVFGISSFFRFYNIDHRMGVGWDQERDAYAVKNILEGKFTLIGPRIINESGFFLPPYFYYLLVPFYLLSGLSLYADIYFIIFYSIAFFAISYVVLSKVFGKITAIVFLAMWAVSPFAVSMDTIAWNPIMVPLVFILFLYTTYKYLQNSRLKYLFMTGLLLGLGSSFHVQFLLLSPMFLPLFFPIGKKIYTVVKKLLLLSAGFLIPWIPLFVFDLRHNFVNFGLIKNFSGGIGGKPSDFMPVWDNVTRQIFGIQVNNTVSIFFYFIVLVMVVYCIKLFRKDEVRKKIIEALGLTWAAFPFFFALYGSRPSEYYFNYLLPVFLIILVLLISSLLNHKRLIIKAPTFALILLLMLHLGKAGWKEVNNNPLSLYQRNNAVLFLSQVTKRSKPFNVSVSAPLGYGNGYKYLLDYHKVSYTGNPKDTLIQIVIPPEKMKDSFPIGGQAIYIPEGWFRENWVK